MKNSGMLAAVALAAGLTGESQEGFSLSAETLTMHFPDVASAVKAQGYADGKADGIKAERDRILGIEAAALPGHEAIIAAHKADGSKTPQDAAMAVINAEKAVNTSLKAGLDADEAKLKGLSAATAPTTGYDGSVITGDNAHDVGRRARKYRADQAKVGNQITAQQALAHITATGV